MLLLLGLRGYWRDALSIESLLTYIFFVFLLLGKINRSK